MRKKNKLICGIGINDSSEPVRWKDDNGKCILCPYYMKWVNMLKRAYDKEFHKRQITYSDVSVCEEWHYFSNFKKWMANRDWKGKELDKDIVRPGNKVYAPSRCVFVSKELNGILRSNEKIRGDYPQGVYLNKPNKKYIAQITIAGKRCYIGSYGSIKEAHHAYLTVKISEINRYALLSKDDKVKKGLQKHAELLSCNRSVL